KRSEINRILADAVAFCGEQNFHLPRWACWSPEDWKQAGREADEIRERMLGWDVTDFGLGRYQEVGLTLFTLRNGPPSGRGEPDAKDYCEKLLLIGEEQVTPTHFHFSKMEDIINRAGGRLVLELWRADRDSEARDESSEVTVSIDGIRRTLPPGGTVALQPGESITLPPYLYHKFYGERGAGRVLAGEVSRVNDDTRDNRFLEPSPRFPAIEEDAPPLHLLCNEYPPADG
ncbi:unnamed protein product, partial [marine sediment metagenome]